MYKLSVPLVLDTLDRYGKEKYADILKKMGAERVFLCPSSDKKFWNNYDYEISRLKKYVGFFKSNGFETGVWVWAFQYRDGDFTYMKSPQGKDSVSSVCPTDNKYRDMMSAFVEDAAKVGIDIFMFDDDFRYTFIDNGIACLCDNHLKMIGNILGEEVTLELMERHLLHGTGNKYREAFVKANGLALASFAKEMREHLDKVNPDVRMGFCSCISQWDIDGMHPDELAKLFAGKTKPFYRLIGAPYWGAMKAWGNRIADVIEVERIECARRYTPEIEIFSEGDTYPRPRFKTPASYLEGFDTALRAAGCTDGILKYAVDYSADLDYENGYISRHIGNIPLYEKITEMFSDKKSIGIRVYDKADKFAQIPITSKFEGSNEIQNIAFNAGQRLITGCSLPSCYEGAGFGGVAFGEHVKNVPEEQLTGLIIDLAAAEILKEKGIDCGIKSVNNSLQSNSEIFEAGNRHIDIFGGVECKKVVLDKNAEIESFFDTEEGIVPASFRYENGKGQRFLVYCYDANDNADREDFYRQYTRAEQIVSAVPWLCGRELPAVITGNPDLYVQVKENEYSMAIGLWNFFSDDIPQPEIKLNFTPKSVKIISCNAKICDNKIILSRIEPYGFAFFEAVK